MAAPMSNMRFTIAYDVSILEDTRFTGVEKLAFYLYQELWKLTPEWRHILFCRQRPARLCDLPENVTINQVSGGRFWRYWQLPKAVRQSQTGVFLSPVTALPGPCGCPLIAYVHECQWRHAVREKKASYLKWMFRFSAWRCPILLTNSEKTRDEIRQELPFRAHPRVEIVSPSADPAMVSGPTAPLPEVLDTWSIPRPAHYCLAVGTIRAKKNIDIMIEAFARPDMADVHLILAGRMDDDSFPEAVRERGLKNVHFAGYLCDPEVKSLYQHALALVYISANEGFGLTLLEAFANACPVIGSRRGSIPEVAGQGAVYLAATEPEALRQAVLDLKRNPDLRASLLRAGEKQLKKYSWRKSAERLKAIIENFAYEQTTP